MSEPPVVLDDLALTDRRTGTPIIDGLSMSLATGTVTALTGGSGSGKTTVMKAMLGWLPDTIGHDRGTLRVASQQVLGLDAADVRALRRNQICFAGQDPGSALNPTQRVRTLLGEAGPDGKSVERVLTRVGLAPALLHRRPAQLSGGQQRRVALARALLRDTPILIIDEPFAGLDTRSRATVSELLRELAQQGKTILVSGHDLTTLYALTDKHVHLGPRRQATAAVTHTVDESSSPNLLTASEIGLDRGGRTVLSGVGLAAPGGCLTAVLGESGAGKTTLARILAGLEPTATGSMTLHERPVPLPGRRRDQHTRARIQLVPQNPLSTLNPCRSIGQILERPLTRTGIRRPDRAAAVTAALHAVELDPGLRARRPHELSGGQRQRVAIARALAYRPDVLICDEVTSALDPVTAETVMALLARIAADSAIAVIVIGHDLELLGRHCRHGILIHEGIRVAAGSVPELVPALSIALPATVPAPASGKN
ncbi:ABC transporter ATP-binding protein [Nocardia sp. NPDC059240]|uniref:ABC transporter ATP-binding protein n=1 Tax=Nocardia sp. NPDC059240 TaxID=3346786 RepID=UPI00368F2F36